jgi:tRNA dimethylallyltransferase
MSLNSSSALAPIFLVGATATGKSELGLALAHRTGGAILAMDAMQVYRGTDIGTSKPSAAERAEIPHGGLDLAEFGASFDVAQYLKHVAEFLRGQAAVGRRVIIVGGTGLYFRALTQGLCEAPQGPDELRAELAKLSPEQLRERLKRTDPAMLERLDPSNPRRVARAIEVVEATGRSLREWQEETPEPPVREFQAFWIQREKAELEKRIAARIEAMFSAGWKDEVRGLATRHGLAALRSFPAIGYRQIAERIGSGPSFSPPKQENLRNWHEELKSDILVATRQYAKRQLTWFNREPNLRKVMLHGTELPSLDAPFLS